MNDQQRPSALDAARSVDAGDHVEAGIITIVANTADDANARRRSSGSRPSSASAP